MILKACRSLKMITWFRHSRFKVPTVRSQYPFCQGDLGEVGLSSISRPKSSERNTIFVVEKTRKAWHERSC